MNVAKYKCPTSHPVTARGLTLNLRPLSPTEIDRALEKARALFEAHYISTDGYSFQLEEYLRILAASSGYPVDFLRQNLFPRLVIYLFSRWSRIQQDHTPDMDRLGKHLRWGVALDPDISIDGATVWHSSNASEFYGQPTEKLTVGQMAYYLLLKSAFAEIHITEKKVSKRWLETLRQD